MKRSLFKSVFVIVLCLCCSSLYSEILTPDDDVGLTFGVGFIRGFEGFSVQGLAGFQKENMVGRVGWHTDAFYQHQSYLAKFAYSYSSDILQLIATPDRTSNEFSFLVGFATPADWWNLSATCGVGMIFGNKRGALLYDGWLSQTYSNASYLGVSLPLELRASIRFTQNFGWGLRYFGSLNSFYSSNFWSLFVEGLI